MDIHNTEITRENVIEFLNSPGANGQFAVPVVQGLLDEVDMLTEKDVKLGNKVKRLKKKAKEDNQ